MTSIAFTEIVLNSDNMPVFLQKYSRTSPQWLPWEQSEMTAGERWRLCGGVVGV